MIKRLFKRGATVESEIRYFLVSMLFKVLVVVKLFEDLDQGAFLRPIGTFEDKIAFSRSG